MALFGCDSFVVLPPLTKNGDIIFGKNSDRPDGEVQEIVFQPSLKHLLGEKLQCTYIEIDQVMSTYAVLLSKPAWMWGAEMGANECGVVIGNEAVWTVVDDESRTERLLGMDLLRLGLERASSSKEAVTVISQLLEQYGQGGICSDTDFDLFYHNSFLIADKKEAWVLETAGKLWAAEKITNGHKNISNCLSITTNMTSKSDKLDTYVKEKKLWSGEGNLNFKGIFSTGSCLRESAGQKLLHDLTNDNQFDVRRMFQVLRDKRSMICRTVNDSYHTSGSWVSVLSPQDTRKPPCHWVTATPDPSVSIFKPFVFCSKPVIPEHIASPSFKNDPAKVIPRFQFQVDRRHELYKLNEVFPKNKKNISCMMNMENKFLEETSQTLQTLQDNKGDLGLTTVCELLKNSVESEINLYKTTT